MGDCSVPVASAQGLKSGGLVQSLGVPLANGYPIPAIIVSDKEDKVRYFATFQPGVQRSVEETLRVVAAVKEVDEAKGNLFTHPYMQTSMMFAGELSVFLAYAGKKIWLTR